MDVPLFLMLSTSVLYQHKTGFSRGHLDGRYQQMTQVPLKVSFVGNFENLSSISSSEHDRRKLSRKVKFQHRRWLEDNEHSLHLWLTSKHSSSALPVRVQQLHPSFSCYLLISHILNNGSLTKFGMCRTGSFTRFLYIFVLTKRGAKYFYIVAAFLSSLPSLW